MEYENFNNFDEEDQEENYQETSFIEDDFFQDAQDDDNLLFDKNRDIKKGNKLPLTNDEKRLELKKYFRDSVYNDSSSRIFLENITFENSATADDEIIVKCKGVEIGEIDTTSKTLTRNMDGIISSGYQKDHREIINYRNTTFIRQIEQNTGEQGFVNEIIADNTRKKFTIEISKREGVNQVHEAIELNNLKEDFKRLESGKKLETQLGREILDQQIRNTRRILEFRWLLEKVPAIGFLLASAVGIITAIILFAKGQFYSASKAVQGKKKEKSAANSSDPTIEQLQDVASKILETMSDNMEMIIVVSTLSFILYRKR